MNLTSSTEIVKHVLDLILARTDMSEDTVKKRYNQPTTSPGTWQFMSYDYLQPSTHHHILQLEDDLQSFFWVLLFTCLTHLPNTIRTRHVLAPLLDAVFHDAYWHEYNRSYTGGYLKCAILSEGNYITRPRSCYPIIKFLADPLNELVHASHHMLSSWTKYHDDPCVSSRPKKECTPEADKLLDSTELIKLFQIALDSPDWSATNGNATTTNVEDQNISTKRPRVCENHPSPRSPPIDDAPGTSLLMDKSNIE